MMKKVLLALALLSPLAAMAHTTTYTAKCGDYSVVAVSHFQTKYNDGDETTVFQNGAPVITYNDLHYGLAQIAYLPYGGTVSNYPLGTSDSDGYFILMADTSEHKNIAALVLGKHKMQCGTFTANQLN
ncbi:hypothetical protein L9F34_000311 [Klebsiella aerogenes]|nr:hypothetical protein [Klebsiella aerogenes]EKV3390531.1 hypothetical protein [Klebsiella aerogenes]EMF0746004.1 hypothetical protein [Klebsiella aerogenes]HCM5149397.1 hypothetical protein [Klebsiella aerogenes]HCU0422931.1 hypothetical protein [Klebsiella aerogenes]HEO9694099.1 hypothetical protein [Klebsiella aerogenes]